jgi:hypothetical protein
MKRKMVYKSSEFLLETLQRIKPAVCLRPLVHWDRGFEFHSKHGCLSVFMLGGCLAAD